MGWGGIEQPCYEQGVDVYLYFTLFGTEGSFAKPYGWPKMVHHAALALVDTYGTLWGYQHSGFYPDECCEPCASKWRFCQSPDDSHCQSGWNGVEFPPCCPPPNVWDCNCFPYSASSFNFAGFDIMVSPCGDCP